jgi:ribose 5-phosphate isomerase A
MRRAGGRWRRIVGVPTSEDTFRRATALGIPLATLEEQPRIDLTIDGADEVDPRLRLIKGLGAALLREKVVASVSARMVVVADASKRVERLGTKAPLPVEVDRFALAAVEPFLRALGADPVLRRTPAGEELVTDGGHLIYDCRFPDGIADPEALEARLNGRPGVLETGLFLGMATAAVIATDAGVEVMGAVA